MTKYLFITCLIITNLALQAQNPVKNRFTETTNPFAILLKDSSFPFRFYPEIPSSDVPLCEHPFVCNFQLTNEIKSKKELTALFDKTRDTILFLEVRDSTSQYGGNPQERIHNFLNIVDSNRTRALAITNFDSFSYMHVRILTTRPFPTNDIVIRAFPELAKKAGLSVKESGDTIFVHYDILWYAFYPDSFTVAMNKSIDMDWGRTERAMNGYYIDEVLELTKLRKQQKLVITSSTRYEPVPEYAMEKVRMSLKDWGILPEDTSTVGEPAPCHVQFLETRNNYSKPVTEELTGHVSYRFQELGISPLASTMQSKDSIIDYVRLDDNKKQALRVALKCKDNKGSCSCVVKNQTLGQMVLTGGYTASEDTVVETQTALLNCNLRDVRSYYVIYPEKHGLWQYWDQLGRPYRKCVYDHGELKYELFLGDYQVLNNKLELEERYFLSALKELNKVKRKYPYP